MEMTLEAAGASLSDIDDKLQEVLGHFRKEFEGEVSAENLGPRYGQYGSFLPTYQRSPAIHPRTPQKFLNINTSRSQNNPKRVEESSSTCETDLKVPRAFGRPLKFRIKVGLDKLSKPPVDGNSLGESHVNIIKIMTSVPMYDGKNDHLSSEKEKFQGEIKCRSSQKVSNVKHNDKVRDTKHESSRRKDDPARLKSCVNKESRRGASTPSQSNVCYARNIDEKSVSKLTSRENSYGKKWKKTSISEKNTKSALTKYSPISKAVYGKEALMKEDWVCCNNCQKWRLLPFGTNPNDFPETWFCDMLNWLPGMNRCSFSEEETTKALRKKKNLIKGESRRKRNVEPDHATFSKKAKVDDTPIAICGVASEKNGHKNDNHLTRDLKRDIDNKKFKDPSGNSHVQIRMKKRKTIEKSSDLLDSTSEIGDIKEKKTKISTSLVAKEISDCKGSPVELVSSRSIITNATVGDDTLKDLISTKIPEKQSENQPRLNSSSEDISIVLKEAKDLKHLADRLMNSGSDVESRYLYFEAALKFLHGASLLESGNRDTAMEVYKSTQQLCKFCALKYEKCKDYFAAALAYKLIEVAYLKVIHSSNTNASKDHQKLLKALQTAPLGVAATQDENILAARNRHNLARILNYAKDVNDAMEASRKSRDAFEAATNVSKEPQAMEIRSSVKKALDFSFHDVKKLARLIRLAMDAINP